MKITNDCKYSTFQFNSILFAYYVNTRYTLLYHNHVFNTIIVLIKSQNVFIYNTTVVLLFIAICITKSYIINSHYLNYLAIDVKIDNLKICISMNNVICLINEWLIGELMKICAI